MRKKNHILLVALSFGTCCAIAAPLGLDATNATPLAPFTAQPTPAQAADCWVEHTQVQPSRARDPVEVAGFVDGRARNWTLTEARLGAEHPSAEARRPCKWPTASGGADERGGMKRR